MEQVKATRMELLKFRRRLKTAQRGHKLLKEKRDGLMKKFMAIIRQARQKRDELEKELAFAYRYFNFATSFLPEREIEEFLALSGARIQLSAANENIMGVWAPKFDYQIEGDFKVFSDFSAPLAMETGLKKFWDSLRLMLDVAHIEHSARLLSFEIERTRRRVNGLEYLIIPGLRSKIKYIYGKLDEQERFEKIIRMKMKAKITA